MAADGLRRDEPRRRRRRRFTSTPPFHTPPLFSRFISPPDYAEIAPRHFSFRYHRRRDFSRASIADSHEMKAGPQQAFRYYFDFAIYALPRRRRR